MGRRARRRGGAGARAGNKVRHADSPSCTVQRVNHLRGKVKKLLGSPPGTNRTRLLGLLLGGAVKADPSYALSPRARACFCLFSFSVIPPPRKKKPHNNKQNKNPLVENSEKRTGARASCGHGLTRTGGVPSLNVRVLFPHRVSETSHNSHRDSAEVRGTV